MRVEVIEAMPSFERLERDWNAVYDADPDARLAIAVSVDTDIRRWLRRRVGSTGALHPSAVPERLSQDRRLACRSTDACRR